MLLLTISVIRIFPPEYTIALGGVATGNMNAHDVAKVAGIMKYNGFTAVILA